MTLLSVENPVFVTFMITASLMILKIMGQGWITIYRMIKSDSGLVNPEDVQLGMFNPDPRPDQLESNDYVERSRRIHRNDLENIPAFLACGIIFVAADPSYLLANILMYSFVAARFAHFIAYTTKQSHEVRATFYTIGSVSVIAMALYVLAAIIW